MTRGRPSPVSLLTEDAQCEIVALGWDLVSHDQKELATLDAIAALQAQAHAQLADGDAVGATRSLVEARELLSALRRMDLAENARHRAIVRTARAS